MLSNLFRFFLSPLPSGYKTICSACSVAEVLTDSWSFGFTLPTRVFSAAAPAPAPSSLSPPRPTLLAIKSPKRATTMDRYQRVEKRRPESTINENEIRITAQGLIRNYISYATTLLQVDTPPHFFLIFSLS
ncbi:hypothetical protein KFK09_005742 [Dendrobium nobile]|uniref:Uncharacterized protein n=1 Tax=Dendrobium nobile TaxID=94219 RepID=A0A8T3BWN9_DENNO|nr:hypothetical protein KFK09_005742 [Dendrobium nobile]